MLSAKSKEKESKLKLSIHVDKEADTMHSHRSLSEELCRNQINKRQKQSKCPLRQS